MVDTLDASINKMKTLQTEARGVDSAFADVRQRVQSLDIELLKSVKVANKLAESFKKAADNIFGARQEMHDLQNRVFKTTNLLKDMDGQLNRVGLGLESNTDETQRVVVESANYTEVLEKMASSLEKMEERQRKMRNATIKQRKEQEAATKAAKEAEEAANKLNIVLETLGASKTKKEGIFEITNKAGDAKILINEFGQEVTRVGDVVTDFNKRTTVLTKTIVELNRASGSTNFQSFQVLGKGMMQTLKVYRQQGGNIFEFFAEGLSGTREEITLFSVEGAKFRKILYGFFPPGAFRLVNKFSSALQLMGGMVRKFGGGSEEAARRLEMLTEQKNKLIKEGGSEEEINEIGLAIDKLQESTSSLMGGNLGKSLKAVSKAFNSILGETDKQIADFVLGSSEVPDAKLFEQPSTNPNPPPHKLKMSRMDMLKAQMKFSSKVLFSPLVGMYKLFKIQLKFTKEGAKKIIPAAGMALKFMMSAMMYLILLFMLITIFKKPIMEGFKMLMNFYKIAIVPVLDGLKNIFGGFMTLYEAFRDGDIFKLFEGIGMIIFGLLEVGFGLFMGFIGTIPALALGFIKGILQGVSDAVFKVKDALEENGKMAALKAAGVILAGIAIFFGGLPAVLAIAVAGLIYGMAKAIGGFIDSLPDDIGQAVANAIRGIGSNTVSFFKGLVGMKANGGQIDTPLTIVGERGPELLVGGRGANVISNERSRNLVGGSSVVNYNITVNAKDTSKAEMRRIADEIGKQINQKMNRKRGANVV